jgi:endonuclease YncB( thermonuclease family)
MVCARKVLLAAAWLGCVALVGLASTTRAEPVSKVFINGVATPVFYNDGDSFKPLAGPYKGSQSRLAGYNTLESYGVVHQWGRFTYRELFVNAKMATKYARKGVWNCETDGNKDGYGRLLMFCKDLATALIRKGLAHAMSVNKEPADPDLLAAQREAIVDRVGMWVHGVPHYILTSLHSTSEGGGKDGKTYNRLVSVIDGHSEKWVHTTNYAECEQVCYQRKELTAQARAAVISAFAARPALADVGAREVEQFASEFLLFGGATSAGALRGEADEVLQRLNGEGALQAGDVPDSCHMYVVDFRRRFGGDRAVCLR